MRKGRIYCSGPLFCPEERAGMAQIARIFEEAGYETFLPHRDGIERFVLGSANNPAANLPGISKLTEAINRAIFCLDIYQIVEGCDALVFNMNGRVPDEGGVVETAVAWSVGRPLVVYKHDARSKVGGNDNSMVTGLTPEFATVGALEALPREVEKAREALRAAGGTRKGGEGLPAHVREALERGRRIWAVLQNLPAPRTHKETIELLEQLTLETRRG